jgi:hypothetical protein
VRKVSVELSEKWGTYTTTLGLSLSKERQEWLDPVLQITAKTGWRKTEGVGEIISPTPSAAKQVPYYSLASTRLRSRQALVSKITALFRLNFW